METIHFKTVDPLSQDLLRHAAQKDLSLNWERYERQQPQDGFLRLGLSCPFGCMHGPCRIDPYGRGAREGICGIDRDTMAAAFLLRLSLQAVLEGPDAGAGNGGLWPAALEKKVASVLVALGGEPLAKEEIFKAANMLSRPAGDAATLITQALRLCLLSLALSNGQEGKKKPAPQDLKVGYGLLAEKAVRIAVAGEVAPEILRDLKAALAMQKEQAVRLLSLGSWLTAGEDFIPVVCTSGEAETVLASGLFHLVLEGRGCDPAISKLARVIGIPVVAANTAPEEIVAQAKASSNRLNGPPAFNPPPEVSFQTKVNTAPADIAASWMGRDQKLALIGGSDTPFLSFGHLPTEMAKALIGEDYAVAAWGDAALWMVKQDLPVTVLPQQGGALSAVSALASAGKLPGLKGVCLTGLKTCHDFGIALGLAVLGLKVIVATPLPVWGSESVRTELQRQLAEAGGLLTSFDHPAAADEILAWFQRA